MMAMSCLGVIIPLRGGVCQRRFRLNGLPGSEADRLPDCPARWPVRDRHNAAQLSTARPSQDVPTRIAYPGTVRGI